MGSESGFDFIGYWRFGVVGCVWLVWCVVGGFGGVVFLGVLGLGDIDGLKASLTGNPARLRVLCAHDEYFCFPDDVCIYFPRAITSLPLAGTQNCKCSGDRRQYLKTARKHQATESTC